MGTIYINTDINAPCCPCEIVDKDTGKSRLIQTDYDFPGVASSFGWSIQSVQVCPSCGTSDCTIDNDTASCDNCDCRVDSFECCLHDGTDGTIDCPECGIKIMAFITAAYDYLCNNDGLEADDPGYFESDE